jgi:mannitol-1-phosphate 5-dehydrogenase
MIRLLVIGAGAIGRGYVPWLFSENTHLIDFADKDPVLVNALVNQGFYESLMTSKGSYKTKNVGVNEVFFIDHLSSEIIDGYDYIITAVGPRNFLTLTDLFKSSKTDVICFENDRSLVTAMRVATGRSNIYFGIPDVISSNTASTEILNRSKLSLITESGKTFVESGAVKMGGDIVFCDEAEIRKQWAAKLYIHNTPHCIAAYLGNLCGKKYLHESMQIPKVREIVVGAIHEMRDMVEIEFTLEKSFLEFYAQKEIERFSNTLLFDPISRVAREPFRKLGLNDRLIGAARKAFVNQVFPEKLLIGVMSAFLFDNLSDDDAIISFLYKIMTKEDFMSIPVRLSPNDVIYEALLSVWDRNEKLLMELKGEFV